MFSNGYRDMKHKYWDTYEKIEPIYNEFFKNVFGYIPLNKRYILKKLDENVDQFKENFEKLRPTYAEKIQKAFEDLLNDNSIPKAAKRVQISMAKNKVDKLQETDYNKFIEGIGYGK